MTFNAPFGGAKVLQTLNITSSGSAVSFSASTNANWLTVNPQTGTTPSGVTVTADPTNLSPTTYGATLSIFVGSTLAVSVPVSFTVSSIGASPQALQFSTVVGSTPTAQTLALSGQATSFSAAAATTSGGNWLTVGPTTGTVPTTLIVTLNNAVVPFLAAATYNGSITITPANGPQIAVPVTLTVTPNPPITVSPTSVSLGFQIGGTNNAVSATQTLTVSTTAGQPLSFSMAAGPAGTCVNPQGVPWVTITPSNVSGATGSTQVTIGYNASLNLPANATAYTCNVQVAAPGYSPSSSNVSVSLLVSTSPQVVVPGAPLNFTYELGGSLPPAQSVTAVATNGTIPITMTVASATNNGSWIVVPATGTTGTAFSVSVNPTGLGLGSYTGTVTVAGTGAGNPPQQIPVNLIVANDPLIVVNGCTAASASCGLSFAYQIGQAAPVSQNITLASSTGASLNYTATANTTSCGNWLAVSGSPGSTPATGVAGVTISVVNPSSIAAGTCNGTITIAATSPASGAAAPNSPIDIPVTLIVSNGALLVATPTAVSITVPVNGTASQQVTLSSTNPASQINYTVTFATASGGPWLSVNQSTGFTPNFLQITATPSANLPAGSYSGSVTITATGATVANSPLTIPVNLTVTAGSLTVNNNSLSFSYTIGGAAAASQTVTLGSSGLPLNYTATASSTGNWLSVSPGSGATNANPTLTISADGSHLAAASYQGTVTVVAAGSTQTINVTLTVLPGTISAPTATLNFQQVAGGAAPQSKTIAVTGTPGSLPFTVAVTTQSGGGWLSATGSGNTPGTVTVSVNGAGLSAGIYNGAVTITATASGSPINVPVQLSVLAAQSLTTNPAALNFSYTLSLSVPQPQNLNVSAQSAGTPFTVTTQITSGPAGWLVVTPNSANTPAVLSVSIATAGLTAGTFNATITITSPSALNATVVPVTLTVVTVPTPVVNAITNAASGATGGVSPGENIVIYGTGIGPATIALLQVSGGVVTTSVGNTRVLFDGVPATMIYASATQTSVMVPYGVSGRTSTNVQVEYLGVQSAAINYAVVQAAPGIYSLNLSGTGPGATLNQNGITVNSPGTPAPKGSVVAVYMTGEGQTFPTGVNGAVTPQDGTGLKKPLLTVTATIGGVPATVLYAGAAPGLVSGVMQVNLQIPDTAQSGGALPLSITVGTTSTQPGITISVQ